MTIKKKIKLGTDINAIPRKVFYVSLVHELIGYCIAVSCYEIDDARAYASEYLGKMWCSVYDTPGNMKIIGGVAQIGYEYEWEEQ